VYARHAPLPEQPLLDSGMEMICAGVAMLALGAVGGEWRRVDPSTISAASVLALGYLVGFGSLLAFTAYDWLVRRAPGSLAGSARS
jgi:drug/metabolite transporter (DMT)-like permease